MGKGKFPFRRTVEFLSGGKLVLQKRVKTVAVSFTTQKESKGLRYVFVSLSSMIFELIMTI